MIAPITKKKRMSKTGHPFFRSAGGALFRRRRSHPTCRQRDRQRRPFLYGAFDRPRSSHLFDDFDGDHRTKPSAFFFCAEVWLAEAAHLFFRHANAVVGNGNDD